MAKNQREGTTLSDLGAFIFGLLFGGIAGIVAALWYAPKSGEQTRQELEQKGKDVRQRIEGESISDSLEAGKAAARKFRDESGQ